MMKIDLIGMILNTCRRRTFDAAIVDDDGRELDAHESLDWMIMEYAKVKNGGTSDVVVVREFKPVRSHDAATAIMESLQ